MCLSLFVLCFSILDATVRAATAMSGRREGCHSHVQRQSKDKWYQLPVDKLPGIGPKGGERMKQIGFSNAGQVHDKYQQLHKEPDQRPFLDWVQSAAGGNKAHAHLVLAAMKDGPAKK